MLLLLSFILIDNVPFVLQVDPKTGMVMNITDLKKSIQVSGILNLLPSGSEQHEVLLFRNI